MSCLMSTGPTNVIPWSLGGGDFTDVLLGLLGSMVRINGLFHLLVNGVYWGLEPTDPILLLTSWDIQVILVASKKPKVMLHRLYWRGKNMFKRSCVFLSRIEKGPAVSFRGWK